MHNSNTNIIYLCNSTKKKLKTILLKSFWDLIYITFNVVDYLKRKKKILKPKNSVTNTKKTALLNHTQKWLYCTKNTDSSLICVLLVIKLQQLYSTIMMSPARKGSVNVVKVELDLGLVTQEGYDQNTML